MKKILLVAAMFAVASLSSFGAACADGTLASLASAGSCTINGWSLDTWGIGGTPSVTGYAVAPTTSDIFVSFTTLTSGGGGLGFSVTFSDAAGGLDYFSATSGNPNQTVDFRTLFVINGAPVVSVSSLVTGATTTANNNGSIVLQKIVTNASDPANPTLNDGTILTTGTGTSTNPLTIYSNNAATNTRMGVVDNYQINSGNAGSASLTSYTNTFFAADPPSTGVPEPMTFVLMGAGLVGVAALRRRNG